jgi:RNA polymerase sigma-70 factor, ECF subfamily
MLFSVSALYSGRMVSTESPGTRSTLLTRLRDYDDRESWRIFFDRYWDLLYNVARKSGLDEEACEDVVQETVIAVAKAMPDFRYDRGRGTFQQWLLRIVRRRIMDQLRRVYREPLRAAVQPEDLDEPGSGEEAVCDPVSEQIAEVWEQEWQRRVFDEAVLEVKASSHPRHFQVFEYCVIHEWPVKKTAQMLGLNSAQVYLAKHRVSQTVKHVARRIRDEWADGDGHRPDA